MVYQTAHFSLDTNTLSVQDAKGNVVETQNKEFELLRFLCEQNKACSEEEILENVWDRNADYSSNVVHVALSKIRKKLGKDAVMTKHNKFLVELILPQEKGKKMNWSIKMVAILGFLVLSAILFFVFSYNKATIIISNVQVRGGNTPLHEWVELSNVSDTTVSLRGWKLQDAALHTYVFGNREIGAGQKLKVITGICEDTKNQVCWNVKKEVWNDAGDVAVLKDEKGQVVYRYSYDFTKN